MENSRDTELAALRRSEGFDEQWYLEEYPDVRMLKMDPAEHYLRVGKKLGREPKAAFSEDVRREAREQILRSIQGDVPQTDALCLFSHFDAHDRIDDYVVEYLRAISDCGFSTIFVTTCEQIGDKQIARVRPYVTKVIVKNNVGRDFGSWFAGIVDSWRVNTFRKVLLANDSVYGPLFDLQDVFEDMGSRSLDVWGITDSFETDYHLQSYFVVFEEKFVNSRVFTRFWDSYRFEIDKRTVIENFEIGLTITAIKNGFRVGALCSYYDVRRQALRLVDSPIGTGRAVRQSKLTPVNASHFFWRALIESCQCPFLKIELLRDNPSGIDDIFLWEDVVDHNTTFASEYIRKHLRRVKPSEQR